MSLAASSRSRVQPELTPMRSGRVWRRRSFVRYLAPATRVGTVPPNRAAGERCAPSRRRAQFEIAIARPPQKRGAIASTPNIAARSSASAVHRFGCPARG